ncbi:MAG: tRNA lysidine(34) synthetase TilS [Bacteroidales bacterium]
MAVAVSGGADSVALVHLVRELERAGRCELAGLAHLNHMLRGEDSDRDERFCAELAERLAVPFASAQVDVRALAHGRGISVESAGHEARYDFLKHAAATLGADRVALGHTRDDQAETFLLRLLRGAGPRGLAGMYPRHGLFVRPLLDCSRADVRAYVADHELDFREDATNADISVPRNRLRHEAVPVLMSLSRAAIPAIGRAATIARDDVEFLDSVAADECARLTEEVAEGLRVDAAALRTAPPAIGRRVAALALSQVAGGRFIGFRHAQALLDLARRRRPAPAVLDLPGSTARRTGEVILLERTVEDGRPGGVRRRGRTAEPAIDAELGTNSFRFSLSIPGEVRSPAGWTVTAESASVGRWAGPDARTKGLAPTAALDAAIVSGPLLVRNWSHGDRFRPLGLKGSKKLQDFFVDRKVPRADRVRVPIVVAADGRVAWVAGHAISEDFRVTAATRDVVILKLKYWSSGT